MEQAMDARINALKPGGSVRLSESSGIVVTVERSGDGKMIRFVRSSAGGFVVIRQRRFESAS